MISNDTKPKALEDVSYWPYIVKNSRQSFSVGSKSVDRYLRVDGENLDVIMCAIGHMDGEHELEWIEDYILREKKIRIDVKGLCEKLASIGLIHDMEAQEAIGEMRIMGVDFINFKFPHVPVWMAHKIKMLWNIVFYGSFLIFALTLLGVALKWDNFKFLLNQTYVYKGSYVVGIVITTALSLLFMIFHELAHWATSIRFGLQPSEFHASLYAGVFPMWYVKIKGMYTVPIKYRIAITSAGMYANALIMTAALSVALWLHQPVHVSQLLSKIIFANFYSIIYTLFPLKLTDGYFIISWITGISNMRLRMLKIIKMLLKGKKEKIDVALLVYLLVNVALIGTGTYFTLVWNFKVFYEISRYVSIPVLKYIILIMPFAVLITTMSIFVYKFVRFINERV